MEKLVIKYGRTVKTTRSSLMGINRANKETNPITMHYIFNWQYYEERFTFVYMLSISQRCVCLQVTRHPRLRRPQPSRRLRPLRPPPVPLRSPRCVIVSEQRFQFLRLGDDRRFVHLFGFFRLLFFFLQIVCEKYRVYYNAIGRYVLRKRERMIKCVNE